MYLVLIAVVLAVPFGLAIAAHVLVRFFDAQLDERIPSPDPYVAPELMPWRVQGQARANSILFRRRASIARSVFGLIFAIVLALSTRHFV
jgi:hypothetical protein